MKLFKAPQIRAWDAYTIAHEPISSLDLMERAAQVCSKWMLESYPYQDKVFCVFCGLGNNGGDGLAIGRLLMEAHVPTRVYVLQSGGQSTGDFQANLTRLKAGNAEVQEIDSESVFPILPTNAVLIDALMGTGLNRPLTGLMAKLVDFINHTKLPVIAIDLPSGMRADEHSSDDPTVKAAHTLTLGTYKLALMMAENAPFFGEVHLLPIGLLPEYEVQTESPLGVSNMETIRQWYKPRTSFGHKGTYGHALIIAGARGKMGACIMASQACLRSGVGLLTAYANDEGLPLLQSTTPEAMVIMELTDLSPYKAIGIGPGMGTQSDAIRKLKLVLSSSKVPMVIDADAINLLGAHPELWENVPPHSILTPHPKEFERLFGPSENDYVQMNKALNEASKRRCHIVLKGHRTFVASPDGSGYFNTGNAGMATGGSGDVLTGILTGLLAQGYLPQQAAVLGVYLHGLAGDKALEDQSMESLVALDIVSHLGAAYKAIAG
jgi:hydroxyethylthiazole kinase-like uncharacterized protein yjeF